MGDLDMLVNCLMHLEMAGVRNNTLVISSDADLHNWLGERGVASFDASSSIASFKDKSPTPKLVEKYRCTLLSLSLLFASGSFSLTKKQGRTATLYVFFLDRTGPTSGVIEGHAVPQCAASTIKIVKCQQNQT